jgi:hypothetical protein
LTGDSRWDEDGKLWELYDLGIDVSDPSEENAGHHVQRYTVALDDEHSDISDPVQKFFMLEYYYYTLDVLQI